MGKDDHDPIIERAKEVRAHLDEACIKDGPNADVRCIKASISMSRLESDLDSLLVEIKRLEGELERWKLKWIQDTTDLEEERDRLEGEKERLRERVKKLLASPRRCDDCPGGDDLTEEVARLRESRDKHLRWCPTVEEVQGLREENEQLKRENDASWKRAAE